ncbi:MAG: BrnT family toxin [Beijerinckiaceae bacterium]|jgi:uncharacterized DUF497 family protein
MKIVWDEPKRIANLAKHGLDQAAITFEFFLSARIAPAKAGRFQALGLFNGEPVSVIFKPLGTEAFSIVSMRPANAKERKFL